MMSTQKKQTANKINAHPKIIRYLFGPPFWVLFIALIFP
jgi:hypothetical protein